MPNPIIKLQNVSKIFNVKTQDVLVLKNINLEINPAEFVIVFGPSGSGKSTLLNVMLGLEPATTGDIVFLERNLTLIRDEDKLAEFRKRNIGIVYQQTNWIKSLNVLENVAFAMTLLGADHEEAMEKAMDMLGLVGMKGWARFSPTELSAGQQQKVSLARALITDPQVIIADEPTGNLDFQSGEDLMKLFQSLQKQGKTIIMVTHNLDNLDYATQIVQVFDGTVVKTIATAGQDMASLKAELVQKREHAPIGFGDAGQFSLDDIKFMSASLKLRSQAAGLLSSLSLWRLVKWILQVVFLSLFILYNLLHSVILLLLGLPIIPRRVRHALIKSMNRIYVFVSNPLGKERPTDSINSLELLSLSVRNLFSRRTRSIITIGGVSLGIGFIVFLVSVGYGLEGLVVSRVATLKQRQQLDVSPVISSNLVIDDKALSEFQAVDGVQSVLPIISVAGKVSRQNSSADAVVYGVQTDYLLQDDVNATYGSLFQSNELTLPVDTTTQTTDTTTTQTPTTADTSTTSSDSTNSSTEEGPKPIKLADKSRSAVINNAFAQVLNLDSKSAVGEKFSVVLTATGDLLSDGNAVVSEPIEYTIVGVIEDTRNPVMYVPILDIKELNITKYSQAKVVTATQDQVAPVRNLIEFKGYRTTSVLDTVTQIEQLFSNLRILLVIIGTIALAVAALGMFNTLTVSLLERTREVGLMKAIGMKSQEVKTLFINESVIMGLSGGVGGLTVGFIVGKLMSTLLSVVSISRGFGSVDVAVIPSSVVLSVMLLSIFVGVVTGIFPALRATKISALNALRYE